MGWCSGGFLYPNYGGVEVVHRLFGDGQASDHLVPDLLRPSHAPKSQWAHPNSTFQIYTKCSPFTPHAPSSIQRPKKHASSPNLHSESDTTHPAPLAFTRTYTCVPSTSTSSTPLSMLGWTRWCRAVHSCTAWLRAFWHWVNEAWARGCGRRFGGDCKLGLMQSKYSKFSYTSLFIMHTFVWATRAGRISLIWSYFHL